MECPQHFAETTPMFKTLAFSFLALCSAALATSGASAEGVVNVYSYRQPQLVEPLFKAFQEKTGIEK